MKTFLLFAAAIAIPSAALAQPATYTVRTTEEISSKDAEIGDPVRFTVDGLPGAFAFGSVTQVEKRGNRARSGELTISVVYIEADGQRIPVSGVIHEDAKASTGAKILSVGAFGLGSLVAKGRHAVIEEGTALAVEAE